MGEPRLSIDALSRRSFVRRAALGAGVAGAGVATAFRTVDEARAATPASFLPSGNDLHLLRRATWGATPALHKQISRLGADRWLDKQLSPGSIDDSACTTIIQQRFPHLAWSLKTAYQHSDQGWQLMQDLGVAAIVRAAWSERQLFEVMVDFWSNHLNVTNFHDSVWWSRHDYDRAVIRAHALGKFSDMLRASAQHPAMLTYLNNAESTKDNPNENYGRELLELHTVGLDAGYTEDEMRTSALILTGLGVHWYDEVDDGTFDYDASNHYTGPVQVLGWSSKNASAKNGLAVALDYVDYLARHPSTARRISTKLCQRFVSDTPPGGLVDDMAAAYRHHDTAIAPVLRLLFNSQAFHAAKGEKVLRPMQDVVSTLRILGIEPGANDGDDGTGGLYWLIDGMSDAPLAWAMPNGYPDDAASWRSAGGTLNRWNAHLSLAAGWNGDLKTPALRKLLPKQLPSTHGAVVQTLAQRLVFRTLAPTHRDAICAFLGKAASDPLTSGSEAVGWRLPYLVALILDSPYHGIR